MQPNSSPTAIKPTTDVRVGRIAYFVTLAVCGCAVDLWTKSVTFAWLGSPLETTDNTWWLFEPYVGVQTSLNPGALFGLGQGYSHLFAALSVLAGIAIVYWIGWRGASNDLLLTNCLGCIMAGILGNLYDRLGLWHDGSVDGQYAHAVRDWILFQYGEYTWPNFNIADSLLVCGAGLLLLHAYRAESTKEDSDDSKDA